MPPGHGFITAVAAVSAKDDPFAAAHGRFPGFPVIPPVAAFHAVQSVDVPAGPQPFVVDLVLTRGTERQGTLVGPTRKPVTGVCSFGLTSLATTSVQKLETGSFVVHGLRPGSPRHVLFGAPRPAPGRFGSSRMTTSRVTSGWSCGWSCQSRGKGPSCR